MENKINTNQETLSKEEKALNRDFNLGSLAVFVFPTVFTFVFIAAYQTVDGFFISQFCDEIAISATNLYFPILGLFLAIGVMLGTGGNAVMLREIARGNKKKADAVFTWSIIGVSVITIILTILLLIFAQPVMRILGASDITINYLEPYYFSVTSGIILVVLQTMCGVFLFGESKSVTAGILIVVGGITNCILDYIFMAKLNMGILGAGIATITGYGITILFAIWFYFIAKKSVYKFTIIKLSFKESLEICRIGLGEFVANIAAGVMALLMNHLIYKYQQDNGLAAVSVFQYLQYFVIAVFNGISMATEPLFAYYYGKNIIDKRQKLFKLTTILVVIISIIMSVLIIVFGKNIARVFFELDNGNSSSPSAITVFALLLSTPAVLLTGFNYFVSIVFAAHSDGKTSFVLSFLRTFVLNAGMMILLSSLFGEVGVWLAWAAAEFVTLIITIIVLAVTNKKYYLVKTRGILR